MQNKEDSIQKLRKKLDSCNKCQLSNQVKNKVFGEGNYNSPLILVGEAPGKNEDEQGKPFVGSAGKLLEKLLHNNRLSRKQVFITNIVKCRPPKNRKPNQIEVEACSCMLEKLIKIIEPKIIAPMGNSALEYFLKKTDLKNKVIGEIHGKPIIYEASFGKIILFPLYHPAAAIYNRKLLPIIEEDFKKMIKKL
ncbi:uracil-DNA glycosylase [Candidatus Bathyarchaeota archaeon]|nr:uracil-DNA glycosylase [Candidatus Bathyarchaeota archaeon]